jgi:L-lactate dehydrogenase complex protein LldF
VRIDIPRMLLALRAEDASAHDAPWWIAAGLRVYRWVATNPRRFQAAGRLTARIMRATSRGGWIRRLPPPLSGWTASRDFPVMAVESFQDRWARRPPPPERKPS